MLGITQIEAIEAKLLEVSALARLYEQQDNRFAASLHHWLTGVDQILQQNRLPLAGKVATLRAKLVSVINGGNYPGLTFKGKATRRKVLYAAGLDILNQATQLLSDYVENGRRRLDDAERIGSQILSVANHYQLFSDIDEKIQGDSLQITRYLIHTLKSHEATSQGMLQLDGLLSQRDVMILIGRLMRSTLQAIEPQHA